jgi:hypothetical protein
MFDKRMGLSFTIAAGPHQRRHSRVRVQWDSWPYFTVSDSRLPFLLPPGGIRPHLCFDSPDIAFGQTTQKTPLLPVALLQCDVAVVADHIENIASNYSSVVAFISMAAVTWHLLSHCLATGMFAEPFSSNSCLCYLHNSGFQQRCHIIILLYWILVTLSTQNSSVSKPVFVSLQSVQNLCYVDCSAKLVLCGLQLWQALVYIHY